MVARRGDGPRIARLRVYIFAGGYLAGVGARSAPATTLAQRELSLRRAC